MNKTLEEKYNMLVSEIPKTRIMGDVIGSTYGLDDKEFEQIVKEIERDGLFEYSEWGIGGIYFFKGLTYKGESFLQHSDKKEYSKIEKTEINYGNTINISGDNHGIAISGDENIILNSEFEKKFSNLISSIKNSNIKNKDILITELVENKKDKNNLQLSLSTLLARGAEVGSIMGAIAGVISLL